MLATFTADREVNADRVSLSENTTSSASSIYSPLTTSPLPDFIQQPNLPSPLLPHNRPNLPRRQHESHLLLLRGRTQLQCPGMLRAPDSIMVIPRIARREVQNLTPRSGEVLAAPLARSLDGSRRPVRNFDHARQRCGQRVAGETPGGQDQLAVRVEVDERADSGARGEGSGERVHGRVFGRVAGRDAAVGLAAGVGRGAAFGGLGVPFEDPVAVPVGADACCVQGWAGLAVFAPETVGRLSVDEAWC